MQGILRNKDEGDKLFKARSHTCIMPITIDSSILKHLESRLFERATKEPSWQSSYFIVTTSPERTWWSIAGPESIASEMQLPLFTNKDELGLWHIYEAKTLQVAEYCPHFPAHKKLARALKGTTHTSVYIADLWVPPVFSLFPLVLNISMGTTEIYPKPDYCPLSFINYLLSLGKFGKLGSDYNLERWLRVKWLPSAVYVTKELGVEALKERYIRDLMNLHIQMLRFYDRVYSPEGRIYRVRVR